MNHGINLYVIEKLNWAGCFQSTSKQNNINHTKAKCFMGSMKPIKKKQYISYTNVLGNKCSSGHSGVGRNKAHNKKQTFNPQTKCK